MATKQKNPFVVILSMTLLGGFIVALARFAYVAYILVQAGESLGSVPVQSLLFSVMELDRFALYGAAGGFAFGVILVLIDLIFLGSRVDSYTWKTNEEHTPFVRDTVRAQRMKTGERFLEARPDEANEPDRQ